MTPDGRTPVVVVTGFLGSGKTTLVNRLLKKQSDSLVIVNELGEVPVDHILVQNTTEKTVALPNGCLCCRLRGDLEEALIGAAMRRAAVKSPASIKVFATSLIASGRSTAASRRWCSSPTAWKRAKSRRSGGPCRGSSAARVPPVLRLEN